MSIVWKSLIGVTPVLVFLGFLLVGDTFRLLRGRFIVLVLSLGLVVGLIAYGFSHLLFERYPEPDGVGYDLMPWLEEILKTLPLYILIRLRKLGFPTDTAVGGFAIGSGFAIIENIYYALHLQAGNPLVWPVRGLGTAVMHGMVTAMAGIVMITLSLRSETMGKESVFPAIILAGLLHHLYNESPLPTLWTVLAGLVTYPVLLGIVFRLSEASMVSWIRRDMDSGIDLLEQIKTGRFGNTRAGRYLHELRNRFPGELIVDLLCCLRLHTEIALWVKGRLMLIEMGLEPVPDSALREKFREFEALFHSIGRTGRRLLMPVIGKNHLLLWQMEYMRAFGNEGESK